MGQTHVGVVLSVELILRCSKTTGLRDKVDKGPETEQGLVLGFSHWIKFPAGLFRFDKMRRDTVYSMGPLRLDKVEGCIGGWERCVYRLFLAARAVKHNNCGGLSQEG